MYFREKLDVGSWSLSDERQFIENLFVGRFNFFIVICSLFFAVGFTNNIADFRSIFFLFGGILQTIVWLTLYRAYQKHDLILKLLFSRYPEHPANIINEIYKRKDKPTFRYSVARTMGVYIPMIFIGATFSAALYFSNIEYENVAGNFLFCLKQSN